MIFVIFSLLSGIFFGIFFRNNGKFVGYIDIISVFLMFLLLLTLGVSIGTNRELIKAFKGIGIGGLVIALSTILGSSGISFIVYRLFFNKSKD